MSLEHSPARFDTVPGRAAYTIPEFCVAHRISRSALYELWKLGKGPRRIEEVGRVIITVEGAADWRREMEELTRAAETVGGAA
jgi:hypothetical protein